MPSPLPALNLIAPPGRRHATLEMAREIERRGFAGISVSSSFANMAQCTGLAFGTERITFATAIAPIYAETVEEFAHGAAYIHEISGGRFQFGIGVAHGPSHVRMGVMPALELLLQQRLARMRAARPEEGHPVDHVDREREPVDLVLNRQLHRRVDVALLLVAADMNVVVVCPTVSQPMDEPGIGVEVEDDGFVGRE